MKDYFDVLKEEMTSEANAISALKYYHLPIKKSNNAYSHYDDSESLKLSDKEQKKLEKKHEKNRKQSEKWLKKYLKKTNIKEELSQEDKELRDKRGKSLEKTLEKNYNETFIKSVERAINKQFRSDKIKKIKLDCLLNVLTKINIYDKDNNLIHDKDIENKITKFYKMKKRAFDSNSDRYFAGKKKKPNQVENLINRSLGEENYFNY